MQPNAEIQVREVAQGQVVVCIILSGAVWWGKLVLQLVSGAVIIRSIAGKLHVGSAVAIQNSDWHRNTCAAGQCCSYSYKCG